MTVTNRYYNSTANAVLGQAVKSAAYNGQFVLVQRGFDLIQQDLAGRLGIKYVPDATYVLLPADAGYLLIFTNVAGCAVTVNAATLQSGEITHFRQAGTAQVSLVAGSGVTFYSSDGKVKTRTKYSMVSIVSDDGAAAFGLFGERDISAAVLGIKTISAATYTLLAADSGYLLLFTNAGGCTVTANGSTLAAGAVAYMRQAAAGQVTVAAGAGVTLTSANSKVKTRVQGSEIAIVSDDGALAFGLFGDLDFPFASLILPNAFSGLQSVPFVSLTDGATINVDASLSNNFKVTLGGNRSLANPTNLVDGCILNFRFKQDGTGSRTLSYSSKYKFPGGTAPVLSTAANAIDLLVAIYEPTDSILICNMLKAFA